MADGPQGIADFMGDAGHQGAQGCQLELLGGFRCAGSVVQENQGSRVLVFTQALKLHHQVIALGLRVQIPLSGGRQFFPVLQRLVQFRINQFHGIANSADGPVQELPGGVVQHFDPVPGVQYDHPGLHVVNDLFVQFRKISDVLALLFDQPFTEQGTGGQLPGQVGQDEVGNAQHGQQGKMTDGGIVDCRGHPGFDENGCSGDGCREHGCS